jgi:hypothetical protein
MRQGATSVVPQMAYSESGFRRCKIAKQLKIETQRLKPNIFSLNYRHD